jgi:5'-3' exonuclease
MRVLSGDATDGIPPVQPGIGEKTAFDLIKIGTLEAIQTRKSCRKKISLLSARHSYIYLPGTEENIERNQKLMDLSVVWGEHKLTDIILAARSKPLNIPAIKQEFLDRQFRSILSEFGTWITPFRSLQ